VPDISALADPNTGLLVGQTQTFSNGTYYDEYRIGGTSVAAPLTAGLASLTKSRDLRSGSSIRASIRPTKPPTTLFMTLIKRIRSTP